MLLLSSVVPWLMMETRTAMKETYFGCVLSSTNKALEGHLATP